MSGTTWPGHLRDAYHIIRTEPEEITDPLLRAHRDLCDHLNLDPNEITDRLYRLIKRCHHDLDVSGYADLLGEQEGRNGRPVPR
ncbi:hypothetical protein [Micromonospora sp. NPDC005324]|uniref:hypothetical protein n=1 Tax=Micromonospora sp. NPDC005324 TaxID=3157033 RepID=UPI0033A778FA